MLKRFEAFVTGIAVCHKYIQRIKTMEMEEYGLKGTHVMCLYEIHHRCGLTAAELCRLCAEDKAAISRALTMMKEKELIVSEGPVYRARWQLTPRGEEIARKLDETIAQWVLMGGSGLSDEERETFYKALETISLNLRQQLDS